MSKEVRDGSTSISEGQRSPRIIRARIEGTTETKKEISSLVPMIPASHFIVLAPSSGSALGHIIIPSESRPNAKNLNAYRTPYHAALQPSAPHPFDLRERPRSTR
jgi:hypothetical protein